MGKKSKSGKTGKNNEIINDRLGPKGLWVACVIVMMMALIILTVTDSCLMSFLLNSDYPVPDTLLMAVSVGCFYYKAYRYVLIIGYVLSLILFIRGCMKGSIKWKETGFIVAFGSSVIMAVMGYFTVIHMLILAFVPLAFMFSSRQLGWFLLIFEGIFGLISLMFEAGGLLTGTAENPVELQEYQWNFFGMYLLCIFVIAWYMFGRNRLIWSLGAVLILAALEIFVFECRTSVIAIIVFIPLAIFVDRKNDDENTKIKKLGWGLFRVFPLVMLAVTVVAALLITWMGAKGILVIDTAFTVRFTEMLNVVEDGVTAWGEGASTTGGYYLDNSYAKLLFASGIVPFICFMLFLLLVNRKIADRKDYMLMVVSVVVYVYSLMENIFCQPVFLLMAGALLIRDGRTEEKAGKGENK